MGSDRITLPYSLFVAGCVALFAAGVNVCLLALVFTGRLTCKVQSDASLTAISAMPGVWCPAHGGKSAVHQTLKQHQPGQLVIDVGAYDGQEAIQYARAGHKVLSFEPTPSKAAKIRSALVEAGVDQSVDFYSYAISDQSGTAPFVVNVGVHMENGQWVVNAGESKKADEIGSEQDGFRVPWNTENSTTVDVRVETLDNMVPEGQYVLFAKIDSQGHDFKVLKGADRLLSENRILVFSAEVSPGLMEGGAEEATEMLNYIASKGYRCFGCRTSFETGFRFGLPIPFDVWSRHLATLKFMHRGANHGQWDDIVCTSQHAGAVFAGMA